MLALVALMAASCSPGDSTPSDAEAPTSETAAATGDTEAPTSDGDTEAPTSPTEAAAGDTDAPTSDTSAPTTEPPPSKPELTSEPVQLKILMESGGGAFDLLEILGEEFSRQHPNVTFEYQKDSFQNLLINGPRALASDDPPDVVLMPQLVDPAKDGLIYSLDDYFEQFGWEVFSASQLAQNRVNEQGVRGSGALYGVGAGYSITGVMYNKELAAQIGMDTTPATLDEFEALMAKAKANGILPIISNNPATFAHQAIFNQYVDPKEIFDFVFLAPGATIDTSEAIAAAERLEQWAQEGYFNEDVNSLGYFDLMTGFVEGEGLFMFNGSWAAAELDERMPGNAGFFAVPPLVAGDPPVAMGASGTIVIPAKSSNPDVAAYFFDWIHTNQAARQFVADVTGMAPGGPPGLPLPETESGTLVERMQEQAAYLAAEGVIVDYLANATSGFFTNSLIPEVQRLVGGQTNPTDFIRALQEGYEASLTR
ncbi:extracellular solute-binding protein [Candidatus Poriferisodalis sp.]|uniref:extracellular solute-binding protein n=1 Tax=Candidatus Poriferisodalis sp. TaxID=3101277 RepID=UPI003B5C6A26